MKEIDAFMAQLSETLQARRKMSGLTQNQLALFANVGKTVIFDLEHGKSTIKLETLLKILEVLNLELKISTLSGELYATSSDL